MDRADGPATGPDNEQAQQAYPMSREGKRQAYLLLIGVAVIWIFAVWSLVTILQDGVSGVEWVSLLLMLGMVVVAPVVAWTLLEEVNCRVATGVSGIEYRTTGGITLAYAWDEIEGFAPRGKRSRIARFFLGDEDDAGTTGDTDNIELKAEAGVPRPGDNRETGAVNRVQSGPVDTQTTEAPGIVEKNTDEEDEEPETLLLQVRQDRTAQIANPLLRFLHRQAHGSSLPLYGGLENRAQLLEEVARQLPESFPSLATTPNPQTQSEPRAEIPAS